MTASSSHQPTVSKHRSDPAFEAIVDWIDRELGEVYGRRCGKGGNTLLELRRLFNESSLNRLFPRFLSLLPGLEKHHYLLGYRIRTLLSSQFQIRISDPLERSPAQFVPLPRNTTGLRSLRQCYFEHAGTTLPPGDIRIQIVPSITNL